MFNHMMIKEAFIAKAQVQSTSERHEGSQSNEAGFTCCELVGSTATRAALPDLFRELVVVDPKFLASLLFLNI
jgi:hypothetical protein